MPPRGAGAEKSVGKSNRTRRPRVPRESIRTKQPRNKRKTSVRRGVARVSATTKLGNRETLTKKKNKIEATERERPNTFSFLQVGLFFFYFLLRRVTRVSFSFLSNRQRCRPKPNRRGERKRRKTKKKTTNFAAFEKERNESTTRAPPCLGRRGKMRSIVPAGPVW